MAKYSGNVGFAITEEIRPGVWKPNMVEKFYYGDTISNRRRLESSSQVNDGVSISNKISIMADQFAIENFHAIRYAIFMGTKWKVSEVEVELPRLYLTLGGVYNVDE